jgi:hypothetical protein
MASRNKKARPPKTETTRFKHQYSVRFNDHQRALVKAAAERRALDIASWLRMVAVDAAEATIGGASSRDSGSGG